MNGSREAQPGRPVFRANTADDLRELIGQAELIVANLKGAGPRAQQLLFLLDTIRELVARLLETGVDLRPETTRIETVERILLSKDAVLVREMARLGGLARLREVYKPDPAQWWWYLDGRVAETQRRYVRKALLVAGGIIAALVVFQLLYTYVFPPDPKHVAAMEKSNQAEQALQQGDLEGALALYREAAEILPQDAEHWAWVGVLEEKLGHAAEAAEAFARCEQAAQSRVAFLYTRGNAYFRLGDLEKAQGDGKAALEINPDYAEAYFLLGGVYEARGDAAAAMEALEQAATLAEKAGNSPLVVMAKYRLGMLMQSAPMMQPQVMPTEGS
ncbi:MAG: tetratricopeptide repeat protein [Anaerolineae bacterium]